MVRHSTTLRAPDKVSGAAHFPQSWTTPRPEPSQSVDDPPRNNAEIDCQPPIHLTDIALHDYAGLPIARANPMGPSGVIGRSLRWRWQ